MKKLICLIVVVLLLSLSFTSGIIADESSSGNTIYVDDDNISGPWDGTLEHPFQKIQDGIEMLFTRQLAETCQNMSILEVPLLDQVCIQLQQEL